MFVLLKKKKNLRKIFSVLPPYVYYADILTGTLCFDMKNGGYVKKVFISTINGRESVMQGGVSLPKAFYTSFIR